MTLDHSSGSIQSMKSNSSAAIVLVLVMIILVLASLFWFLYRDYDAVREVAGMADSRATRVAAMEQEAGQLRAEADQIQQTRTALEAELTTAVTSQETLEQEAVDDQQLIQQLETRIAAQIPEDSVPIVIIISPANGHSQPLAEAVELTVAAFDPSGISAIKIVFDENPPLEIPVSGGTSTIIHEPWPLSEAGEYTAVVTAVNRHNISSQITSVTITIENRPTSQQIVEEVANIIGPANAQASSPSEAQVTPANSPLITPLVLQAFDFEVPQTTAETAVWGEYCTVSISGMATTEPPVDPIDQELALVQTLVQEWQDSQFQISQQVTNAANDDARAALCALAAGHERWVLEEYIRRAPADRQDALLAALREMLPSPPIEAANDVLTAQQNFASAYGPTFFNAITAASGATAVLDTWSHPPQTSAHILSPNDYAAGVEAQTVTLPDLTAVLGDEWTPVTSNVLGAFMLEHYLGNFAEADEVATAVSGWNGDRYAIYQQGAEGPILLALQINWLSDQDAQEFADVYSGSVNGRLPQAAIEPTSPENSTCWTEAAAETICLFTNGSQSLLVSAPQATTAIDTLTAITNN